MSTYEVPEAQWQSFCQKFTEQHRGDWLDLEQIADSQGVHSLARHVMLQRLELVSVPAEIVITVDDGEAADVSVPEPSRIRLEQPADGGLGQLRIDSRTDAGVILRLTARASTALTPSEL